MVVVLTNLRSEDAGDALPAIRTMQRRHLVVLASLREKSVEDCVSNPIESFDDALLFGSTHLYLEQRRRVFEELRSSGVVTIDAIAEKLPIELTNAYLEMKRAGRL